mmetsp:Transcript_28487/g.50924  ORF Transcript_28487/g.50924 Transcript_28487/m.50924 type:complete len:219 (+) Transcript_28487:1442-2098(+)
MLPSAACDRMARESCLAFCPWVTWAVRDSLPRRNCGLSCLSAFSVHPPRPPCPRQRCGPSCLSAFSARHPRHLPSPRQRYGPSCPYAASARRHPRAGQELSWGTSPSWQPACLRTWRFSTSWPPAKPVKLHSVVPFFLSALLQESAPGALRPSGRFGLLPPCPLPLQGSPLPPPRGAPLPLPLPLPPDPRTLPHRPVPPAPGPHGSSLQMLQPWHPRK